jgi:hypothetical protein
MSWQDQPGLRMCYKLDVQNFLVPIATPYRTTCAASYYRARSAYHPPSTLPLPPPPWHHGTAAKQVGIWLSSHTFGTVRVRARWALLESWLRPETADLIHWSATARPARSPPSSRRVPLMKPCRHPWCPGRSWARRRQRPVSALRHDDNTPMHGPTGVFFCPLIPIASRPSRPSSQPFPFGRPRLWLAASSSTRSKSRRFSFPDDNLFEVCFGYFRTGALPSKLQRSPDLEEARVVREASTLTHLTQLPIRSRVWQVGPG